MNIPFVDSSIETRKDENSVIMKVTPELAKKWLTLSFGNRPFRRANYDRLVNIIQNDHFEPMVNSIKFSNTGKLIDGHHRLRAIIDSNKSVFCKIEYDLPEHLAYVIDTNAEARSARDILHIDLIRNGLKTSVASAMSRVAKSFIDSENSISAGVPFTQYGLRRITVQEIQEYCNSHLNEITDAIKLLPKKHLVSFASAYKVICDKDSYHGKMFFQKLKDLNWDVNGRDSNIRLLHATVSNGNYPKNTAERKNKIVRQIIRCYNKWAANTNANSQIGRCDGEAALKIEDYID